MTGRALGLKICLAGLGVADYDGGRPHASRIAAVDFEFVNERCDVGDLLGGEGELVLVRSRTLEERLQHFTLAIPHHIFGAQQIGAAIFAAARILAVTVSAVGRVRRLAAGDAGGVAGRTRRELARALNQGAPAPLLRESARRDLTPTLP